MRSLGLGAIDFEKGEGLVPVVAKDASTGKVLMLAYANRRAVERTMATGMAHYYSRSRQRLWMKGEESGHTQKVREIRIDCDNDSLLYVVEQKGPACHTGNESCFYRAIGSPLRETSNRVMMRKVLGLLESAEEWKRDWVKDGTRRVYSYLVNQVTEGIPYLGPDVLSWIVDLLDRLASPQADKVVTFEALGIPYASALALLRGKPLVVIRKRDFGSKRHLLAKVGYSSGFERGEYFVYGVTKRDRILLVDDMVSTGGSLVPTVEALMARGVDIADVVCVCEKPQYGGAAAVRKLTGRTVKTLFRVSLKGGKAKAEPTPLLRKLFR